MGQFLRLMVIAACSILMTSSQSVGNTTTEENASHSSLSTVSPSAESAVTSGTQPETEMEGPMSRDDLPTSGSLEPEMTNDPGSGQNGPMGTGPDDVNGDRQPVEPPVWIQCLNDVTDEEEAGTDVASVFKTWCSNQDAIVECLARDLPANAFTNPFDFFLYLNFDPVTLRNKTRDLCRKLEATGDKLSCASAQNETLSVACGHGFSRGLFHIFDIFHNRDVPSGVLREIACDVTTQTTLCQKYTFPDCEEDVITAVLNYYALFTNDTCVAQPGDSFPVQNPSPEPPETVIVKCANEAAQTLTSEESASQPTSLVDFVIFGLRADCKTYEARYACYHRELSNITNFMDFWLSLTFDYNNAMTSQQTYCSQIEESIIPGLTDECFNHSQPALSECELGFSREVETIRQELLQNGDFDEVELQTIACRTSVTRAVCLGNAMQHCGETIAKAMSVSEMGILPDICRELLTPRNGPAAGDQDGDADSHQGGSSHADDTPSYGIQTNLTKSHRGRDREGIRENKNSDGMDPRNNNEREWPRDQPVNDVGYSDGDHKHDADGQDEKDHRKEKGGNLSASKSQPGDDGVDDGVGVLRANEVALYLVVSFMVLAVFRY